MKKQLIAAAVSVALSQFAWAQTNVTVYGMLDAGVVVESGGKVGSVTKVGSGIAGGSRLGFKGSEDLGGAARRCSSFKAASSSIPACRGRAA
jgi:predicted porin